MGISLEKGQKISLSKEGSSLKRVVMGLGWDAAPAKGFFKFMQQNSIDLDASCLLFDEDKDCIDIVYFGQLQSACGNIKHTGDNRTGDGEGDDEQIIVNLEALPTRTKYLVFVVNSYTGQTFSQVQNAFCRIFEYSTQKEIAKYNLSVQGNHTAQIMCKVYRHNGEWKMHAIGEPCSGRTADKLIENSILFL